MPRVSAAVHTSPSVKIVPKPVPSRIAAPVGAPSTTLNVSFDSLIRPFSVGIVMVTLLPFDANWIGDAGDAVP